MLEMIGWTGGRTLLRWFMGRKKAPGPAGGRSTRPSRSPRPTTRALGARPRATRVRATEGGVGVEAGETNVVTERQLEDSDSCPAKRRASWSRASSAQDRRARRQSNDLGKVCTQPTSLCPECREKQFWRRAGNVFGAVQGCRRSESLGGRSEADRHGDCDVTLVERVCPHQRWIAKKERSALLLTCHRSRYT